ncbi:hypothetical protein [Paenibacillus polymyxa]|uniref:Uncharacterized protein n=1 Tax=Paenibacillus polymyxa TaxID=1406 RepID=A0AAP4ECF0_PAEPO|nr:hypothetical protein [Paenibacillus polymyxa]MDH2332856.1 hypothetical protein [Paenibacillus polymyxa]
MKQMGDKVRIEVTFNTDKHADILAAMKKFGSQAGFLKSQQSTI